VRLRVLGCHGIGTRIHANVYLADAAAHRKIAFGSVIVTSAWVRPVKGSSLRDRTLCALDRPTRRLGDGYVTMMA
jgi:hypothetical protein